MINIIFKKKLFMILATKQAALNNMFMHIDEVLAGDNMEFPGCHLQHQINR